MDKSGNIGNGNPNWSWVGLKNYIVLFTDDEEFYVSLFNNIRWLLFSLVAIPIGLLLPGTCSAQICSTTKPKIKNGNK